MLPRDQYCGASTVLCLVRCMFEGVSMLPPSMIPKGIMSAMPSNLGSAVIKCTIRSHSERNLWFTLIADDATLAPARPCLTLGMAPGDEGDSRLGPRTHDLIVLFSVVFLLAQHVCVSLFSPCCACLVVPCSCVPRVFFISTKLKVYIHGLQPGPAGRYHRPGRGGGTADTGSRSAACLL